MIYYDVLIFWKETFAEALRDDVGDLLRLSTIKIGPLQDDPIYNAPYLLVGIDDEKGMQAAEWREIGGPMRWKLHLFVKAAPRMQPSIERLLYYLDALTKRIVSTIIRQGVRRLSMENGGDALMISEYDISAIYPNIFGGEREWNGSVRVEFAHLVEFSAPSPFVPFPDDVFAPGG